MDWLLAPLRSTVGKKFVMGITGLFLCAFLVIHLAGNLLLYVGADTYNKYAHGLHNSPAVLTIAQVLLYAGFAIHIYLAIVTAKDNRAARSTGYAVTQSKRADRKLAALGLTPDSTMFATGALILLFLIVHLSDFKFGDTFRSTLVSGLEPFDRARVLLREPVRALIYFVGSLIVGIHVAHGFQSAFQSLGVNHPRYRPTLQYSSWLFAILIAVGFASFSLWGLGADDMFAPVSDSEMAPAAPEQH